ncbi:hypothetical protein CMI47_23505 [Candidatus Pacearchaeota archaeon]|jgi:hypothetical protein|nr:hypothetical protein [Candidatus Pacearchaeota archaeon]|tara:strand:+ start:2269 stop:2775 length:507 start_codon:yes stop_codon:yes gene_type:complete
MRVFDITLFKEARFGSGTPTAFQSPVDRDDPYPSNFIPNDGKSRRITQFMNQGLPGETPDISSSGGKYSRNDIPLSENLEKPVRHPYINGGDPDLPFGAGDVDGSNDQYGNSNYGQHYYNDDSPLSRLNEINRLNQEYKDKPYDRKTLTSNMGMQNIQSKVRKLTKSL